MSNRLSKIITRTGDDGSTMLADGSRCMKSDLRIHCLGEVDELNAWIGLVSNLIGQQDMLSLLTQIQHDLFDLGAELSQPDEGLLGDDYVTFLEERAETYNANLPPLVEFILPGGSDLISHLHVCRTVCRRVERNMVALNEYEELNPVSLQYINRLSDLLFIIARHLGSEQGQEVRHWQSRYSRQSL